MNYRFCLFLALISLLPACGSAPPKSNNTLSMQEDFMAYANRLRDIQTWALKGRLGIRAERGSGTLNILWDQDEEEYVIRFIAPFGQGAFDIRGFADTVVFKDASGLVLVSPTAEELLENTMGLKVRLEGLAYWLRGIPEPGEPFTNMELDEAGRLQSLDQANVSVKLSRYSEQGAYQLPGKIKIKGDGFRLSFAIHNWDLKLNDSSSQETDPNKQAAGL